MANLTSYKKGIQYNKQNNGSNTLHRKQKNVQYEPTENRGEPEHIYKKDS
jgi:hypothetical protein